MTVSAEGIIVSICGRNYSIKADVNEDITRQIAKMVDEKIAEIQEAGNIRNDLKAAVLSAMNFAGELHEYKDRCKKVEEKLDNLNNRTKNLAEKISRNSIN